MAGVGALALCAALGSSPAVAQQTGEVQDLFRQVLANPSDAGANTRYAQAAERQGELRKALAAYERIILADPNNTQARAEYERIKAALEPAQTHFQVGFGLQYESNVRLDPHGGRSDIAGQLSLRMDDERHVGGTSWRTGVQVYGDTHLNSGNADFMYGSVSTGPVLTMENGWRIHPSLNAEVGGANYNFLFYSVGLGAAIETRGAGWLRGMTFGVSYADFTSSNRTGVFHSENGRDAVVVGGRVKLGWENVFTMQDFLSIAPGAVYNIARAQDDRFWQVGVTAAYATRLASFEGGVGNVYLAPEVTLQYRAYAGQEPGHNNSRKDTRVVPGMKLIGTYENKTVVLSYLYDHNDSNYNDGVLLDGRQYRNHRVGLNFYVDF
ncbi:MAG: tetratricopeptide repeat protein [Rhodospirillales bacterium]